MNASECRKQAFLVAKVPSNRMDEADSAADRWASGYMHRDATVDPGTVLVDEVDPETFEHRTVEKQLHPARKVRPFVFGAAEVRDLANHIRRELRLR